MKQLVILLFIVSGSLNIYSQWTSNDTITSSVIKSNWAFRFDIGLSSMKIFNHKLNSFPKSNTMDFSFYYQDFSLTSGFSMIELKSDEVDLIVDNLDLSLGYTYDFRKKWGSDLKIGLNSSSVYTLFHEVSGPNSRNSHEILNGVLVGIGFNKYFKLKRFNYLVARLGVDYYKTNYDTIYQDLGNGAINYSLKIGYKGWFRKEIK